jgi:arginine decarboxylase
MKVSITSGRAEGPTKLNAFDNALLDAKLGMLIL